MNVDISAVESMVPDGWELVRIGPLNEGDNFLSVDGDVLTANGEYGDMLRAIIKPKRWRADKGEEYYYVGWDGNVELTCEESYPVERDAWEFGNYFKTAKEAESAASKIRDLLLQIQEVSR